MDLSAIPEKTLQYIYERSFTKINQLLRATEDEYKIKLPEGCETLFIVAVLQDPRKVRNLLYSVISAIMPPTTTAKAKDLLLDTMEGHNVIGSLILRSDLNVPYGASQGRCMYKRLHKYEPSKPEKRHCCEKPPP